MKFMLYFIRSINHEKNIRLAKKNENRNESDKKFVIRMQQILEEYQLPDVPII